MGATQTTANGGKRGGGGGAGGKKQPPQPPSSGGKGAGAPASKASKPGLVTAALGGMTIEEREASAPNSANQEPQRPGFGRPASALSPTNAVRQQQLQQQQQGNNNHHAHHNSHQPQASTAGTSNPPSHNTTRNPSPSPPHTGAAAPSTTTNPSTTDPTYNEYSHPFHAPLDHVREEERPLHLLSDVTHFDVATLRKLQVLFTDIAESDVDDGIIDGNELTDAMGLESSCLLARTIFRIFDATAQKRIDFAGWCKTISALSIHASLEEKIRFSFNLYDLNGDGEIDVEELRAMLEAAVLDENILNLSSDQVKEWCDYTLSTVDRDGNGKIDYEEYKSMVENSTKFLESFTLDIHALCTQYMTFRAGRDRSHSKQHLTHAGVSENKMSEHEVDQRLLWFRSRQKLNIAGGSATSESSYEDDSNSNSGKPANGSGNNKGPSSSASAKTAAQQQIKGGSGIHKPIAIDPTVLPSAVNTTAAAPSIAIPAASTSSVPASSPNGTPAITTPHFHASTPHVSITPIAKNASPSATVVFHTESSPSPQPQR